MSKLIVVVVALVALVYLNRVLNRLIDEFAERRDISQRRVFTLRKLLNFSMVAVAILTISFVLGLQYHQIYIFLSSVLAVIGVALFAQWSILSHLTAGIIIFFAFPYRVGDRVKVVDADEDITGEIMEIASFHVLIRRDDGADITYPNSALLQKPVIKLRRNTTAAPAMLDEEKGEDQLP
ncbi:MULTISPECIES: mechanosensitive ion channel domain-containing protein [Spongiibacter]|uniref:mechanosensitive ion channel domain-containing protein n=1 Tax=Spongiibacter TaxID=630749 RepID=UPI000C4C6BB5|nr:mechanosensitive ion channel domain-containing protein [Spongiibacter sp.]MBU70728.1 mechanosensitive ion channel protein MscS [Spongiibacter sp.]